jgi:hypothetical protein
MAKGSKIAVGDTLRLSVDVVRVDEDGDPVADWFERCLDLHGGIGRKVPAAA